MTLEPLEEDYYQTLKSSSEGIYKEKGSKFLAYAFPVQSLEEVEMHLAEIKKKHFDARHHCYAYRFNPENPQWRVNDDGEPGHSAGTPILHALMGAEIWDALIVVVRYFGGTKLGVSGLIRAYRSASEEALTNAQQKDVYLYRHFEWRFPYSAMSDVSALWHQTSFEIVEDLMAEDAGYLVRCRKSKTDEGLEQAEKLYELEIIER